ncbi:hypothetical protein AB1Y20_006066 [Prymnesium parvum]|uniref:Ribosome biogenesis protein NOP53 n=1 Tax=Prymnesium parvum TaxID=97485 RepID=A0AB34J1I6_PRYPA
MAKSIRSKVKKRLRTVKRGILKQQLDDPTTKVGVRRAAVHSKLAEAATGHLQPAKPKKNWFKSDDPDAEVPQYNWRQGPDFRSQVNPESGYALWGSNRPKLGRYGGDAPSARPVMQPGTTEAEPCHQIISGNEDGGKRALVLGTEQIVPLFSSSKVKKKLKKKAKADHDAPHRWT